MASIKAGHGILPQGKDPTEKEKEDKQFDHINVLELVAVILNIWIAVRYLMLQPIRNAHIIMNVLAYDTSALSWMQHAARTKRPAVRNLARFLQALLTHCPLPIRLQGKHLPGKENIIADLLSRFLMAPSWGSVIVQSSPTLDCSNPCRVPCALLSQLARLLRSDANEEMSATAKMRLWTLELEFLPNGWRTSRSMTSLSGRSHGQRRFPKHGQAQLGANTIVAIFAVPRTGWRRASS